MASLPPAEPETRLDKIVRICFPMRLQLLAARTAFAALVLAVLIAAGAIAGVRLGYFAFAPTGHALMIPATLLGLVALLAALVWFRQAFVRNAGEGKRMGMIALLGSLVFLYPPLSYAWAGLTSPPIHDASSNPDDAPHFVALLKERPPGRDQAGFDGQRLIRFRGEEMTVAYALHEYYGVTQPRAKLMPGSPDPVKTLFWRCFETVKALGWTIVDYSEAEGRIEATARSFWFGEISDIVVRARAAGAIGARPDIRAASRTVEYDHGANLSLLEAFMKRI